MEDGERWVFGRSMNGAAYHAVLVQKHDRTRPRSVRVLCNGVAEVWRIRATGEPFRLTTDGWRPHASVCRACTRIWLAEHTEPMPGLVKVCAACGTEQPVNQFHEDRRTRDMLSKTCFTCDRNAADVVAEARKLLGRAAQRQQSLDRIDAAERVRIGMFLLWQSDGRVAPLRCGECAGEYEPSLGHRDDHLQVVLRCACGSRDATADEDRQATEIANALTTIDSQGIVTRYASG